MAKVAYPLVLTVLSWLSENRRYLAAIYVVHTEFKAFAHK